MTAFSSLTPLIAACLDVVPAGAEEEDDAQGYEPDEDVLQGSEG